MNGHQKAVRHQVQAALAPSSAGAGEAGGPHPPAQEPQACQGGPPGCCYSCPSSARGGCPWGGQQQQWSAAACCGGARRCRRPAVTNVPPAVAQGRPLRRHRHRAAGCGYLRAFLFPLLSFCVGHDPTTHDAAGHYRDASFLGTHWSSTDAFDYACWA